MLLRLLAATLATTLISVDTQAQNANCFGDGGAILEIESVNSAIIGPGSDILLRLRGTPGGYYCLICDFARGEVSIPLVGPLCSALTPSAIVSGGFFGPNGVLEMPITLPSSPFFYDTLLCCLFLDATLPITSGNIRASNRVCICQGFGCDDKISSLELATTIPIVGAGPFAVVAEARKNDDNGDLIGRTTLTFDPANPPTLPFSSDGNMTIENISVFTNEAVVLFRIDAANFGNDGVLPSNTYFDVGLGGNHNTEAVHTSCSQDIGIGFVFDEFTITDLVDPSKFDECRDGRKPGELCLRYTGADCSVTTHRQDPGKVNCSGDPAMAPQVWIRASDNDDPTDSGAKVWFEGPVNVNEVFELRASNAGETKLKSKTFIHILTSQGGSLLQFVEFHTSCSQPLQLGDRFGAVTLECFRDPNDGNLCDGQKAAILTMTYDGSSCAATSHAQDPGKVSCSGDPAMAPQVYILATDNDDPNDPGAKVWFQGPVSLNGTFAIDAANANETKLKSKTFVYVFSGINGPLLQSIEFHTSCSQPLRIDDQFGSVRLTGFVPE